MNNTTLPPKLPSQAPPQLPPQTPSQIHEQQSQSNYSYYQSFLQKKRSNNIKLFIGLLIGFVIVVSLIIIAFMNSNDDKSKNFALNKKAQNWRDKAIEDSTHMANGYFSANAMYDFEIFNKKYHELVIISLQHTPKEVTDSAIITFVNRNAYNALGMLCDSTIVYRNKYTKILKEKLWEDNIEVKTENGGKTLWLIGGFFASNRNIKEFQSANESMFKALGYKRICYKWVDVRNVEYTYYDLE